MYTLIFVFVVSVFTVSEANIVSKRQNVCGGLIGCSLELASFRSTEISSIAGFTQNNNYRKLCQANANFLSCLASNKGDCQDPRYLTLKRPEEIIYLCSDEGKEGLRKIANSPCIRSIASLIAAEESTKTCKDNSNREHYLAAAEAFSNGENFNQCPIIERLYVCYWSSLTNHCGSDFSTLVKKVWYKAFKSDIERTGCSY